MTTTHPGHRIDPELGCVAPVTLQIGDDAEEVGVIQCAGDPIQSLHELLHAVADELLNTP